MNDPILEALNRAAEEMSPADIDAVIAHLRKTKLAYDRGEKPKKEGQIDNLAEVLGIGIHKKDPNFVRRA